MKTNNINETKKIAEKLLKKISQQKKQDSATLITLSGDLGAGKTTFTQQIGELLAIQETINSPTFVISKEYDINEANYPWSKLIHIDAYRLERQEDMDLIGLTEQLQEPKNIIFLEWPEMIEKWLPKENRLDIKLTYLDELSREISW